MNVKLKKAETYLVGRCNLIGGVMTQDSVSSRIQWLTESVLSEILIDGVNWSALYLDPEDGRYWELTYPQSHMQGGDPLSLSNIPIETAEKIISSIELFFGHGFEYSK